MPLELTKEGKQLLEKLRDDCKDLAKEFNINIDFAAEPFYDQHKTGFQELSRLFNFLKANNSDSLVEQFDIANNIIQNSKIIDKKLKNIFIQKITNNNFKELLDTWKKDKELPYNHLQVRAIIHVVNKLLDPKFLAGCADQSSTPEKKLLAQHFKLIDNETKVPIPYLAGDFKFVQKLFNTVNNLPDAKTKLVKYTGNFVIAAVLDKKLPELINNLFNVIAGKQQLLVAYENCTNSTDELTTNSSAQNQLKILIKKLSKLEVNDKKFTAEYSSLRNEIVQYLDSYLKKTLWQNLKLNKNSLSDFEDKTGLSSGDIKSPFAIIKELLSEEASLANRASQSSNFTNEIKIYLNKKYLNTINKINEAKSQLVDAINKYEGHKDKRALLQNFKTKITEIPILNKINPAGNTAIEENIFSLQKNLLDTLVLTQSYFIQMNEVSKNIKELPGKGGSLIIAFLTEVMEATKIYSNEIHINETITDTNAADLITAPSNIAVAKEKNTKNKFSFFKSNNKEKAEKNKFKEKTNANQPKATKPKQTVELLKLINQIASDEAAINNETIVENFARVSRAKEFIKNISLNKMSIEKYLKKVNKLLTNEKVLNYTITSKASFMELQQKLDEIIARKTDRFVDNLLEPIKNTSEKSLKSFLTNLELIVQNLPENVFEGDLCFAKAFCRNFNYMVSKRFYIQAENYEELKDKLIEVREKVKSQTNANIIKRFFYYIQDVVKTHTENENNDIAKVKVQLKQF